MVTSMASQGLHDFIQGASNFDVKVIVRSTSNLSPDVQTHQVLSVGRRKEKICFNINQIPNQHER